MSITHLQIKLGSLAAEARLIRRKERAQNRQLRRLRDAGKCPPGIPGEQRADLLDAMKLDRAKLASSRAKALERYAAFGDQLRQSLYLHRMQVVRPEARAACLALAYLHGRMYASGDRPAETMPKPVMQMRAGAIAATQNRREPKPVPLARVVYHLNQFGFPEVKNVTEQEVQAWVDGAEPRRWGARSVPRR